MSASHPNPLAFIPDYVERKGSLFLRSDHMDYGRPTLVSNWWVETLSFDWFRWLAVAICSYCVLVINITLDPVFAKCGEKSYTSFS